MARTWYQIAAGPAPWENAYSFTSSSSYSNSGTDSFGYSFTQTGSNAYTSYFSGNSGFTRSVGSSRLTSGSASSVYTSSYLSYFPVSLGGSSTVTTGYIGSSTLSLCKDSAIASYNSDYDSPSYVIVSTALTSGTGTNTYTYASTTNETTDYTYVTVSYVTRSTTNYVAQTASYLVGSNHAVPVISADYSEFLRIQTATGSTGVSKLDELVGNSFLQTTLNSAIYSYSKGAPHALTAKSNTVSVPYLVVGTSTITVSAYTYITVTQQAFDGWIGGTATQETYLSGATTITQTIPTYANSIYTYTAGGEWAYTAYQQFLTASQFSDTITGINESGGSVVYPIVHSYLRKWVSSYLNYEGGPGLSVTKKYSPSTPFFNEIAGGLQLLRADRFGGYQAPSHMGSNGDQGKSISAASSFYIGTYNIGLGSPANLFTPFLTGGESAFTSNSFYSFSFGGTNCSVTAARTESSTTLVGTITNSYTTETITFFTVDISAKGIGDSFCNFNHAQSYVSNRIVAGGAHAWTGGQQNATLTNAFAWRYTIGDGLSTTSYKQVNESPISTTSLGSSIMAAETFRAGTPAQDLREGLPEVLTFAYSDT